MLIFAEGGQPDKNPRSKGENQQQTQITCDAESGNRTRDHSGEASFLPLHHPCSLIRLNMTHYILQNLMTALRCDLPLGFVHFHN
jgi:hypothetical protein